MQVKLDELIRATKGAHNALLDLEELDDKALAKFKVRYGALATEARSLIENGDLDTGTPKRARETPRTANESQSLNAERVSANSGACLPRRSRCGRAGFVQRSGSSKRLRVGDHRAQLELDGGAIVVERVGARTPPQRYRATPSWFALPM